jgi:hypothetical protein
MTDLLATFQAELALLLRALVLTGIVLGLERGFRRRAERKRREQLPPEWRRALDDAYGPGRG